ncbi:hypothetical protein LTR85_006780 [Meristemomyces frigidus]|nr:hypothetical protein LTR85_006780 [Meristemomyces frigidus]
MAVLQELPGLVVTLDVADQDLPEYDDDETEDMPPHTTSKYVEAQSGAHFGVAHRYTSTAFPHSGNHIKVELSMDGNVICYVTDSPGNIASSQRWVMSNLSSIHGDKRYRQRFAFAELDINDGPADKDLWGKLTELGTISVKFYRVRFGEPRPMPRVPLLSKKAPKAFSKRAAPARAPPFPAPIPYEGARKPVLEKDQVPEKNLKGKAISHQAKLAAPVEDPAPLVAAFTPPKDTRPIIMIDTEPFATFNFKYRSHAALQALRIIPRTPSPVPLEARPLDELTPDEMRELLRRQREQSEKSADLVKTKKEMKKERGEAVDDEEDDELEVIEHRQKRRRRSGPNAADEIVDLCEDD